MNTSSVWVYPRSARFARSVRGVAHATPCSVGSAYILAPLASLAPFGGLLTQPLAAWGRHIGNVSGTGKGCLASLPQGQRRHMPNNQKHELVEPRRQSIVKRRRRAGIAAAGVLTRAAQAGLRGSVGPLKAYRRPPTPRPEQTHHT